MGKIKLKYPTVFKLSKDNSGWWEVSIPDVFGAVTCGDSFDNAVYMAKDLLKELFLEAPFQFNEPSSFEETKNNFPNDIVMMIEFEIESAEKNNQESQSSKTKKPFYFVFRKKLHEVDGSLIDYRTSRIYIVDNKLNRIKEIKNIDTKYRLLQIARSDCFNSLLYSNTSPIIVYFDDGKKAILKYRVEQKVRLFDRRICSIVGNIFDEVFICLELGHNEYVNIGKKYDNKNLIFDYFTKSVCDKKTEKDYDFSTIENMAKILETIDKDCDTGHVPYAHDFLLSFVK